MSMTLAEKQYVDGEGVRCPRCGSERIVARDNCSFHAGRMHIVVDCYDCGSHWTDVFALVECRLSTPNPFEEKIPMRAVG